MKNKTAAIYARVSTDKQKVEMQLEELKSYIRKRGFQAGQLYVDQGYTGGNLQRPAFVRMLSDAHKRSFDVLIVWKLDRLSRSLKDLITTLETLGSLGIDFISYDNSLDTSTPTGKLVFHVVGSVAEFERDIIRDRVRAGLANARRKGIRLGRPSILAKVIGKIHILKEKGLSNRAIARQVRVGEATVRRALNMD
ncbi:recombinase family protein [Candidatus Latescibacterota bacterium]